MVAFRRFVAVIVIVSIALFMLQQSLAGSRGSDVLRGKQHIDAHNRDALRHFTKRDTVPTRAPTALPIESKLVTASPVQTPVPPTMPPSTPAPTVEATTNNKDDFQTAVVNAFLHSWKGYKAFAWGADELKPVSKVPHYWPMKSGKPGLGLTIVESLDTMWLMGLRKEFDESVEWVTKNLDFDKDMVVSLFETTIRLLGGLCSAYDLTGNEILLKKAVELADRLMPAFNTPTGIPNNYINLRTGFSEPAGWNGGMAILSEFGSIQLEFRRLSQQTKNDKYDKAVTRCFQAIVSQCSGFCARYYSATSGRSAGGQAALGGFGDSYYEYLLKQHLQLNKKSTEPYGTIWDSASKTIVEQSIHVGKYVVPGSISGNNMEHLACFTGGLYALSYYHTKNEADLKFAEKIAFTCHEMYQSSSSKLAPDSVSIYDGGINPGDSKYILRPETVETYFYLWRVTKDPKYREWGYEVIKACDNALRVEGGGYSGTHNVNGGRGSLNDQMESFWMAETLKYLYLLASDDSVLDISKWVFNTEAHPLRVAE
jgi:mannosyl-oligosaccharide alpha-1,2-mannosidase